VSSAERVAKHRALADAGLVALDPKKIIADEVGLEQLLIAWQILPPALIRNATRAELSGGVAQLLAKLIAAHKAALEAHAGGALLHAKLKFAIMVDESDSHGED
jgi:hypothetical protein